MKIVVDTDSYSGNFERNMCAFATAQIGDCGVGVEFVDSEHPFSQWWEMNIILNTDDNGVYRPVEIEPTPGFINDGMGGHYEDTPENRLLANKNAVEKMVQYHQRQKDFAITRLKENNVESDDRGWTKEACLRALKHIEDSIEHVRTSKTIYPAYQSISIRTTTDVPENVLVDFKERVYNFAKENGITILNIRCEDG